MSGFNVQILLRLIDKLTAPAKKASQSYGAMAQSITRSSAQIRSASAAAAGGVTAIGNAAARSNRQVASFVGKVRQLNAEASRSARRRGGVFGDSQMMRGFGGYMGMRSVVGAAYDTAKSENKFRALVDNVTAQQMKSIRTSLMARTMKTGESYAMLIDAAGDAAQIVGSANLASDIAIAASKLANIDTSGKDVAYFAENLAAIIGPKGTLADLRRIGDQLAMQQKLGAATAGGTIEAYKNIIAQQQIHGAEMNDALTVIGLIKNFSPALQDSSIGVMGKYAIRTLANPINDTNKKLKAAGLSQKDFRTDGQFDIAKTQALFHRMIQTKKGLAAFNKIFAGKNVQAGDFWGIMAKIDPALFEDYYRKMTTREGELDETDLKRLEGIVEPINKLRASLFRLSLAFGELITPAVSFFGNVIGAVAPGLGDLTRQFSESYPVVSGLAGTWLALVGSLGVLGLFSGRAAALAGFFARLPVSVVTGFASGIAGAVTSIASMARAALRARGILGSLLFTLRGLAGGFAVYLIFKGVKWFYDNWDKIKELVKEPLRVSMIFPELPRWLQAIMGGTAQIGRDLADIGTGTYNSNKDASEKSVIGMAYDMFDAFVRNIAGGDLDKWGPSFAGLHQVGVPEIMRQPPSEVGKSGSGSAVGVAAAPITNNTNSHNVSVVNNVTVNAATNADPNAIGAATANAVGAKVRGALSDAPHSAP